VPTPRVMTRSAMLVLADEKDRSRLSFSLAPKESHSRLVPKSAIFTTQVSLTYKYTHTQNKEKEKEKKERGRERERVNKKGLQEEWVANQQIATFQVPNGHSRQEEKVNKRKIVSLNERSNEQQKHESKPMDAWRLK
jgi:hypothetical protein